MPCANPKCKGASDSLKFCAKCNKTTYCSRDCQKEDWKAHKKICGKQTSSDREMDIAARAAGTPGIPMNYHDGSTLSPPKGLDGPITKPYTKLNDNTWLHGRPETDVYKLLIDAYRMKMADQNRFEATTDSDNVYDGAVDSTMGFTRFLDMIEVPRKRDILPEWWDAEHKAKCIALGRDAPPGDWYSLKRTVEKQDIIDRYGDPRFPMQLRMFAEVIYERGPGGPGGNDSSGIRRVMAATEAGTMGHSSVGGTVDINSGRVSRWM